MLLKKSTARNRMVFMVDETDHVSGATGLTLTITASKDGAAFASISPTVTERGNGWYSLALTTSHTDTLGDLAQHITATGADPTDLVDQVVNELPGESVAEPAGVFAWPATPNAILAWLGARMSNEETFDGATLTTKNRAADTDLATATCGDLGGTTTKGSFS